MKWYHCLQVDAGKWVIKSSCFASSSKDCFGRKPVMSLSVQMDDLGDGEWVYSLCNQYMQCLVSGA